MPNDVFGIKMIYPPKAEGGQEWFLDDNPEADGQIDSDPEQIEKIGDYFTVTNTSSAILAVAGVAGTITADCTIDYAQLADTGYRLSPLDWRNQEQTIFMYLQDVTDSTNGFQSIGGRTFTRSAFDDQTNCCERARYRVDIYNAQTGTNAGRVEFKKLLAGITATGSSVIQTVVPTFYRRWVGHKFIIYNVLGPDNETQVKLEHWICPSDSATDKENGWTLVNSFIDTGTNFGTGGTFCGGEERQAITWGNINVAISLNGDEIRFKNWSVREIDINGDFSGGGGGSGGGTGGTGSGNCGAIDTNGIKWIMATGTADVISQSRNQSGDDRWSKNFDNIYGGWEATAIGTFSSVGSGGHCAMKMWGGNHSGSIVGRQRWYDLGIRANGDIQTQWEGPHPTNHDFTPDSGEQLISNLGHGMDGQSVGLKWLIYPIVEGGDATHGGMKVKFWVDPDPLDGNGRPKNGWILALDITDTGTIIDPASYHADSTQELEMRNSDTGSQTFYAGGLHMRYIRRPQDLEPCVPGGGGGGTTPPPDPVCPTGFHWNSALQVCVQDTGGGTNPDPPAPETLYNDFTIVYNINSDSDGCICNDPGFTPPPPVEPPPGGGTGGNTEAVFDISYQQSGATIQKIGSNPGSSSYYLRWGEIILSNNNDAHGKNLKRIEWPLGKVGEPTGTATIVIRKGDDDTIGKTMGTFDVAQLQTTTNYVTVENTVDTYTIMDNDKILVEYDGGDADNYVVGWMMPEEQNGAKVARRSNTQSPGTYGDRDREAAFRAYA